MGKIIRLREWLTVLDTARYLSIVFEEEVTEADVLRLALEGRLRLSVHFVNYATAHCGKVVRYNKADLEAAMAAGKSPRDFEFPDYVLAQAIDDGQFPENFDFPKDLKIARLRAMTGFDEPLDQVKTKYFTYLMMPNIDDDQYLWLDSNLVTIKGVWDLLMIGGEQLDVENKYQRLTGGPIVTLRHLSGTFVEGRDGKICALQTSNDDNENTPGSRAQLEKLKRDIADKNIEAAEAEKLLNRHKEDRKRFLIEKSSLPESYRYYSAQELPKDSVLVVRTDALREFEAQLNGLAQKPESTRKTENLLRTLTCLAIDAYGYDPQLGKNTAPKDIADAMSARGFLKDEKTIRGWLKEGADLLPPIPHKG